jgi:predicted transcriptional regulator
MMSTESLLPLTTQIVSAHIAHNATNAEMLPDLIRSVHSTLAKLGNAATTPAEPEKPQPAVAIRRSVQSEHIVCLECGKRMKMLKRHLKVDHQLKPEQYRERFSLPADYPMVAPNYAALRSAKAKEFGLGRRTRG